MLNLYNAGYIGATLYPHGEEMGDFNFFGDNIWNQFSYYLNEGNTFTFNCRPYNTIVVSICLIL